MMHHKMYRKIANRIKNRVLYERNRSYFVLLLNFPIMCIYVFMGKKCIRTTPCMMADVVLYSLLSSLEHRKLI